SRSTAYACNTKKKRATKDRARSGPSATFHKARVIQALVECSQEVRESFARSTVEEPDRWHRRLLRACRERPRGRRAAEQRDEIASSHAGRWQRVRAPLRTPDHSRRSLAEGERGHWRARDSSRRSEAIHGQADCTVDNFRTPGGDRDRERAAIRRGAGAHARALRVARAADGQLRGPAGDLQLAR